MTCERLYGDDLYGDCFYGGIEVISGGCGEPCLRPDPCPQQVPEASSPDDRLVGVVPCPPGGDC